MHFGSSGIRDIINKELSADEVAHIGALLPSQYETIVVGYDARTSSVMLKHALIAGIISAGGDVYDAGLAPTPTLALAAHNFDCGLMITASHNPPEYNGLKFWNPDGSAFDEKQRLSIERLAEKKTKKRVDYRHVGALRRYHKALEEHCEKILNAIQIKKPLKVVLDCGNGAGSVLSPYVLEKLGCNVITINAQPDGFFPGRASEPSEEHLDDLKSAVVATKADVGIAHDGDADRMVAVDESGQYVAGDKMLCVFARYAMRKKIVVPVDTSMAINEFFDGEVIKDRVGDAYISERLKKVKGDFGGESSGAWIFPEMSYCPDGIYAAAKLVEIISTQGALSELISEIPSYKTLRGAIHCEKKEQVMKRVEREFAEIKTKGVAALDGVRADFEDGWLLVRASGTEPKIRVTAEAKTDEQAAHLYMIGMNLVKKNMENSEK